MTLRLIVLASALARFPASRHPRPDLPHTTASGNAGSESIATLARTNRTHAKSTATIEAYGPIANWHVLDANGTAGSRRGTVLISQMLSARDNFMYSPVVDTLKRPDSATGERDGAGSFSSALLSGGVKDTYIKGDTTTDRLGQLEWLQRRRSFQAWLPTLQEPPTKSAYEIAA